MATIKKAMFDGLFAMGMFENQANEVITRAMADERNSPIAGRWNEDTSAYPAGVINLTWLSVKDIAYEWIKEKAPMAWFRPMFAPGMDRAEDKNQFITDYWENVRANAADNLTMGSKQAQYSLKHLEAGTGSNVDEDFRGDIGPHIDLNSAPATDVTIELVKQPDGGYTAQVKAADTTKPTLTALAVAFYRKVLETGLERFHTKVSVDPADARLVTFTATPRVPDVNG